LILNEEIGKCSAFMTSNFMNLRELQILEIIEKDILDGFCWRVITDGLEKIPSK